MLSNLGCPSIRATNSILMIILPYRWFIPYLVSIRGWLISIVLATLSNRDSRRSENITEALLSVDCIDRDNLILSSAFSDICKHQNNSLTTQTAAGSCRVRGNVIFKGCLLFDMLFACVKIGKNRDHEEMPSLLFATPALFVGPLQINIYFHWHIMFYPDGH